MLYLRWTKQTYDRKVRENSQVRKGRLGGKEGEGRRERKFRGCRETELTVSEWRMLPLMSEDCYKMLSTYGGVG